MICLYDGLKCIANKIHIFPWASGIVFNILHLVDRQGGSCGDYESTTIGSSRIRYFFLSSEEELLVCHVNSWILLKYSYII